MLEAQDIAAGYDDKVVISFDRLTLVPGDRIAVIGSSGSGKTTLLRVFAGLHHPFRGSISCDGIPLSKDLQSDRSKWVWPVVTLVFQEARLFPNLSAKANCLVGVQNQEEQSDFVVLTAERFGVAHLLNRRPWQMSQGQRQRFCLIRALVRSPRYLLLDEPMSALDPTTRDSVGEFLIEWASDLPRAIFMATHDWAFASLFATSFYAIKSHGLSQHDDIKDAVEWLNLKE